MPAIQRGLVRRPRTTRAISSAIRRAFGVSGPAGVEMIELGRVAQHRRGGREAAGEVGDAVTVEQVALAVVLRMHQHVGVRDAGAEAVAGRALRHRCRHRHASRPTDRPCRGPRGSATGRRAPRRRPARRSCRARRRTRARDRRRARRPAASGLSASSSSSAATLRTARSNSAIWLSKMSRNRPEMRRVTSMRGRSSVASGITSMPVTRFDCLSQTGRTPR